MWGQFWGAGCRPRRSMPPRRTFARCGSGRAGRRWLSCAQGRIGWGRRQGGGRGCPGSSACAPIAKEGWRMCAIFSLSAPCMLRLAIASPTFSPLMPSLTWPHFSSRARGYSLPLCVSASACTQPLLLLPGPRRRLPPSPMWGSCCSLPVHAAPMSGTPILFHFYCCLFFFPSALPAFSCLSCAPSAHWGLSRPGAVAPPELILGLPRGLCHAFLRG